MKASQWCGAFSRRTGRSISASCSRGLRAARYWSPIVPAAVFVLLAPAGLRAQRHDAADSGSINKLHRRSEQFIHFTQDPSDPESLSDDYVQSISEDRFGNLWIGLYVLTIGTALYAVRRYEMNRIHLKNQVKFERLEAEKLKELDRTKSRFFANISHEFRTPLTLILGPIHDLIEATPEEERKEKLTLVQRSAEKVLRLINQLLDLSRLENGRLELRAAPGDIVAFVKGLTMAFASLAERKGIELGFHADRDSIEVYFDRDKLEDIVANLLSNAFKFTPEGGRIEVTITVAAEREKDAGASRELVEIVVKDTGIGIPPDVLPRIFDRFYHVNASATREHQGAGIGLALLHELMRLHHGRVDVESAPGKGTTFFIRLPVGKDHLVADEMVALPAPEVVAKPTVPVEEARAASTMSAPDEGAERQEDETIVLLVEDSADLRTFMHEKLQPRYKLLEASDGAEGLEKARETIPDLVVSDVMMPKMNGYELCRALKDDERTSHIPVILLTAKASRDEKLEGLGTGADDYLTKPFDSRELLLRVSNLIEQRRKLRRRFSQVVVLKPSQMAVSSVDEAFLNKALAAVERHLGKEDFSVETLAQELGLSRSQLHRKLRALTNQSPTLFTRSIRLERGAELLEQKAGNVAEIAYTVGFNSQAYFTKCFHERFGCTPSDYAQRDRKLESTPLE